MWAEVNGERKKVACGPCIRGHRSSKCDHRDRVLVEVRKPGRPLSSCPHPTGSCSCERVVINYTIPKTSECGCPSERGQSVAPSTASGRVQKQRLRKSVTTFNTSVLERAIKANQDAETDSSSLLTRTPTSETNSAPSSASSTPRLLPSRKASQSSELPTTTSSNPTSLPTATPTVSSCCQPKPVQQVLPQQGGSCCSNKAQEVPKPIQPVKSCCGGSKPAPTQVQPQFPQNGNVGAFGGYPQYNGAFPPLPYGMMNQNNSFAPMPPPFSFNTPIYNHVGSMFHPQQSVPMSPMVSHTGTQATDHNCHCGDSCSCFGCAAHPNNATMMEYIRSMHQYMSTGQFTSGLPPTYDLPTYSHHAPAPPPAAYGAPNYMANNHQMSFQPANTMAMPGTPLSVTSQWSVPPVSTPIQNPTSIDASYFESNDGSTPTTLQGPESLSLKTEELVQSPTATETPSEGKDEDTPTLSPSSYFWQEVVLPGCNDATGTCQCGDGCECVGCLTHGGHNGVPLSMPTVDDEQNTFSDFVAQGDIDTSASADPFMDFANVPG